MFTLLLTLVVHAQQPESCTMSPDTCPELMNRFLFRILISCGSSLLDCARELDAQYAALIPTDAEQEYVKRNRSLLSTGYTHDDGTPSLDRIALGCTGSNEPWACRFRILASLKVLQDAVDSVPGDVMFLTAQLSSFRCSLLKCPLTSQNDQIGLIVRRRWYSWKRWRDYLIQAEGICLTGLACSVIHERIAEVNASLASTVVLALGSTDVFDSNVNELGNGPGNNGAGNLYFLYKRPCVGSNDVAHQCLDELIASVLTSRGLSVSTMIKVLETGLTSNQSEDFFVEWAKLEGIVNSDCGWDHKCYSDVLRVADGLEDEMLLMHANASIVDLEGTRFGSPSCWYNCLLVSVKRRIWGRMGMKLARVKLLFAHAVQRYCISENCRNAVSALEDSMLVPQFIASSINQATGVSDTVELVYVVPGLFCSGVSIMFSVFIAGLAKKWNVWRSLFICQILIGVFVTAVLRMVYWSIALKNNINPVLQDPSVAFVVEVRMFCLYFI